MSRTPVISGLQMWKNEWTNEQMKERKWSCSVVCKSLRPMDCSLPGSSVYGIFQARVLEWAALSFSRESSRPRDRIRVSHIAGRCFTFWDTGDEGSLWCSRCCQPPQWLLRSWGNARSKVNKETGLAPESAYKRNEFSESRGFHLPLHRMLNSLSWYLIWSLMVGLPDPFVAVLHIAWLPILRSWSSFLRATEVLSPRLRVRNIPTK